MFGHHSAQEEDTLHTFGENSTSLGFDAVAKEKDSVALGSNSLADRDKGVQGSNPLHVPVTKEDLASPAWTSTAAAVSVGNVKIETDQETGKKTVTGITRQITGVAAGSEPTDAVNPRGATPRWGVNTDNTVEDADPEDAVDGKGSNYNNLGAVGKRALAAGYYTSAVGKESTALGNKSLANGENSVATGYKANAQGLWGKQQCHGH